MVRRGVNRCIWAFIATFAFGPVVLATSAGATLNVSVTVQRSCTVTRTATVQVTCVAGGVPAVVEQEADGSTQIDNVQSVGAALTAATSEPHLRYVTIQF